MYADGTRKDLFYIFGVKDLAAVYKKSSVGSTHSSEIGYVVKDHLGSVWALANETGGFVEKYSYDPWGRRMMPDSWNKRDSLRTTFFTDRGFTLHEHYDKLQIINMNARMYDPIFVITSYSIHYTKLYETGVLVCKWVHGGKLA